MVQTSSESAGRNCAAGWRDDRLDSWKEIAAFFRREVRTVQLWEKREGLPVRRQHHSKLGSVYGYRTELEQWWVERSALNAAAGKQKTQKPNAHEARAASLEDSASGSPRILALPFEVIHSAPDRSPLRLVMSALADALRDEITLAMVQLKLHPIILSAKALPSPGTRSLGLLKTVAGEFNADLLLSGAIHYVGARARVYIQMIDAKDLRCLWSERFDCDQQQANSIDLFPAARVAHVFYEHVTQPSRSVSRELLEPHRLARNACAIGVHFWKQRSRTSLLKAIGYFEDAAAIDPQCAIAYAGIADAYVTLSYNHMMCARDAALRSYQAVQTALRLDSSSLTVRNAQINVLINCTWEWPQAERECSLLVDSGMSDGRTIQLYSTLMGSQGRHDQAIELALDAHRLDPFGVPVTGQVSLAYFYAGDYSNALSYARRSIELRPQFTMGHAMIGRIAGESGDWDVALSAGHQAAQVSGQSAFALALLAYAFAGSGDSLRASEMLKKLEDRSSDDCYPAYEISAVHAMLNQETQALEHLSKACTARDMKTIFMKQDPWFSKLRMSPGFQQIAAAQCGRM